MLPSVQKSERFKIELEEYRTVYEEMSDGPIKIELKNLIGKLVHGVKELDDRHMEMALTRQLGVMAPDIRDTITQTRKRLQTIVRDWKESQKHQA
jgi:hypothetical protein